MAATTMEFASVDETIKHPAYPGTIWALEPDREGHATVAKDRGGPVRIAWEIHGSGPTKIVFIMGLAGVKASWQRQTSYFGHEHGDKYSVLIFDNRGMGGSDRPFWRYTTSEMARDTIEVLDEVGWTAERDVHVVGISLGGMIAQEIAVAVPDRLRSLSLLCTSAHVMGNDSFSTTLTERLSFLVPKTVDRTISETALRLFPPEWLEAPDEGVCLPVAGATPRCGPPPAVPPGSPADTPRGPDSDSGDTTEYLRFDTNYQRFLAQELVKRVSVAEPFTKAGLISQLLAGATHRKTDEQLAALGDALGRDRIMVMHGTRDKMIVLPNGEKLMAALQPGVGLVVEGMGHAPIMERPVWLNSLLEERFVAWEKL